MPKSKNLIFSLIALSLAGLLIAFMLLRDSSVVLSPYEFHKKLLEAKPQSIVLKDNELSFSTYNETYKVARDAINLSELDPHIAVVVAQKSGSFLDEIGLFVIIFIGVAVLIKAVSLLFMPPKPQPKGLDINAQNLSGTIARKEQSPMIPLEQGFEPHFQSAITFRDVAGITQVKEELFEIIDYLKNTKKYQDLGIRLPKGVLLVGPPGVGKTMIAKAVAGEAGGFKCLLRRRHSRSGGRAAVRSRRRIERAPPLVSGVMPLKRTDGRQGRERAVVQRKARPVRRPPQRRGILRRQAKRKRIPHQKQSIQPVAAAVLRHLVDRRQVGKRKDGHLSAPAGGQAGGQLLRIRTGKQQDPRTVRHDPLLADGHPLSVWRRGRVPLPHGLADSPAPG